MRTNNHTVDIIETQIPMRLDRLPWSRFHKLVILALGITWILEVYGYLTSSVLMLAAAALEAVYGVKAEQQGLENVAIPLSSEAFGGL